VGPRYRHQPVDCLLRDSRVIGFMRAVGWGRIVAVTSVSGTVMASRGDVAYAAAKAGLATGSQVPSEVIEGALVPMGAAAHPTKWHPSSLGLPPLVRAT